MRAKELSTLLKLYLIQSRNPPETKMDRIINAIGDRLFELVIIVMAGWFCALTWGLYASDQEQRLRCEAYCAPLWGEMIQSRCQCTKAGKE